MGLHVRYIMWEIFAGMERLWTVGKWVGSAADEDYYIQEYQPWIQVDFTSMSTGNNAPRNGEVFFIFKQYLNMAACTRFPSTGKQTHS
jgi:hypothetical protein